MFPENLYRITTYYFEMVSALALILRKIAVRKSAYSEISWKRARKTRARTWRRSTKKNKNRNKKWKANRNTINLCSPKYVNRCSAWIKCNINRTCFKLFAMSAVMRIKFMTHYINNEMQWMLSACRMIIRISIILFVIFYNIITFSLEAASNTSSSVRCWFIVRSTRSYSSQHLKAFLLQLKIFSTGRTTKVTLYRQYVTLKVFHLDLTLKV